MLIFARTRLPLALFMLLLFFCQHFVIGVLAVCVSVSQLLASLVGTMTDIDMSITCGVEMRFIVERCVNQAQRHTFFLCAS